jgi:anti-sigma-K factor RskA
MIDHLTTDRLTEYVDGLLDPSDVADVERHLSVCAGCARDLSRMRALLGAASSLPRAIEPPSGTWSAIRDAIEARKVATLPVAGASRPRKLAWRWLAAASVLVVVATGSIIAFRQTANRSHPATAYTLSSRTASVVAMMIDRHYVPAIDQLTASLRDTLGHAQRKNVPAVARSLVIVDSAIAETRAALIRDPGNRNIADLLAANYQRKLDLLKRASELASEQ